MQKKSEYNINIFDETSYESVYRLTLTFILILSVEILEKGNIEIGCMEL